MNHFQRSTHYAEKMKDLVFVFEDDQIELPGVQENEWVRNDDATVKTLVREHAILRDVLLISNVTHLLNGIDMIYRN